MALPLSCQLQGYTHTRAYAHARTHTHVWHTWARNAAAASFFRADPQTKIDALFSFLLDLLDLFNLLDLLGL
jgi:hypothetical protein